MTTTILSYKTRDAWLQGRREGIGGSDAPRLLGEDGENGAINVYLDKIGERVDELPRMQRLIWGHRLERPIIEGYGEDAGRKVWFPESKFEIRRSVEHPFACYSPDGFQEAKDQDGVGVIQVKNVSAFRREDWLEGPPLKYTVQIQHEMMVEGAKWGSLVALFGGNECAWFDVTANPDFHAALLEMERDLWDCVQKRKAPAVDVGLSSALATLKVLYPKSSGGTIYLQGERWNEIVDGAIAIKEEIDDAERRLDQCKAMIQAEMKEAEIAILPDGRKVSWKSQSRKEYTVKASEFRVFRLPKE